MSEQEWEDKLAEVQKHSEHWYNKYKELENQNKLLGERCNQLLKDKGNLTDELAKWKDEWQEQVQKAIDEGYARTLQTMQLTNAKEHIKQLLDCLKQDTNDPETNYYVCQYMDKAEQFLREIDIDNAIQQANEGLNFYKIADEVEQDIKEQKEE